jgi:hypothetical protein
MLEMQRCLSEAGFDIDLDGMTFELDENVDFEAFEEAMDACNELLGDAFGEFEATPEQEAMMADAELKFNQCMADNGFEMSDGAIELDEGDFEKMEEATAECDDAFDELNEAITGEGEDN